MSTVSKALAAFKPQTLGRPASLIDRAVPTSLAQNSKQHTHSITTKSFETARTMVTVAQPMVSNYYPEKHPLVQEASYLRSMVKEAPYIFETQEPTDSDAYRFPLGTLFKAPTPEVGLYMKDMQALALKEHGIVGIELGFNDPDSHFMLKLVEAMGCTPDSHSSTQGALWDVTYRPEGTTGGNGDIAHSRSHSLGEFAWHTDGSYEPVPQRYFGFHILHPDKQGGGVFRVLKADDLISMLSPQAADILINTEFDIKVPAEFYRGVESNKGKLLELDDQTGRVYVRFRRDILPDPPSSDPAACEAVEELNRLLDQSEGLGTSVPNSVFKENTILLMDNARFLHMRTDIKDPKRWLRRVRFHGNPGHKAKSEFPLW
ncbi:hypothetical protein MMC26_007222 [Xylographa opegraphella]|nr:hypothetical protein [Xylographa opegraphella]